MASPLPTYDVVVNPKYYSAADGAASGYRVVWLKHSSPTVAYQDGRFLQTPGSPSVGVKSWEWWLAFEWLIDASWDSSRQGDWGTEFNLHNQPTDVGNTGQGGIGWGFGVGTSSVQFDYIAGDLSLHLEHSSWTNKRALVKAALAKGVYHSALVHLILGRVDGSVSASGHPNGGRGRVRVYLDGSDVPFDSGDQNTLQRAQNPSNSTWYVQTQMSLWEGHYTRNSLVSLPLRVVACRVGRTLSECLADGAPGSEITLQSTIVADILDPSGVGPDLGPSRYQAIASRLDTDFQVPPSLGGTPAPPPQQHLGPWTAAVQWNSASDADPPPVPPSVVEQHLGPWTAAVGYSSAEPAAAAAAPATGRSLRSVRRRGRRGWPDWW